MAQETLPGGDGNTGETGLGFRTKANNNFTELYGNMMTREFNRAFVENLIFDKNEIIYSQHTQDDEINFTIALSDDHLVDSISAAKMVITADGLNAWTFGSGFNFIYGIESGDIPDAGTYEVYFLYVNGATTVNVPGTSSQSSGLTKLSTPGSFNVVPDGENALDMTWTDVDNEVEYQIEKSLTGISGWVLHSNPVAGSTSATETGLNPGDIVYFRIKAVGDNLVFADSLYATDFGQTENSGDTTPPTFTFDPVNGESEWTVNRPITITANEPIRNDDGTTLTNANVAFVLTLKETNSVGADIPFTATISSDKTVITITPTTIYGETQVVYVAINDVEDFDGNEIVSASTITFTTTDWTYFNGTSSRLAFGDILDSIIAIDNTNFEFSITIRNHQTSGYRNIVAKSDPTGNQRCFLLFYSNGQLFFNYYKTGTFPIVQVRWLTVPTDGTEQILRLTYNGNIDTNFGYDRANLYINGVLNTSKDTPDTIATVNWYLFNSTAQLSVGVQVNAAGSPSASQFFVGEMKDFIFKSNSGATTQIDVPLLADGEDVSGNNRDGTWVL